MQFSQESYRTRWLVLVALWTLSAYHLFTQAGIIRDYLNLVSQLGARPVPVATPMRQPFPAFAADAEVWVRHALSLAEGNQVRLRYTTIDNAPNGREVHWNSAWAWTLVGSGWVYHLFTGDPLPNAIERSTLWLTPTALLFLLIIFSAWVTRQAGLIAGAIVAVAMTCHDRIYEGFFPSYVDHHGLLTVAVFGTILGAIFMGGGWWQASGNSLLPNSEKSQRNAATFSALSGACGLWVSAASVIPSIAITGFAALLAVLIHGRTAQSQGAVFNGNMWRLWGRIGGGASIVFYLLEYFPSHMSFRLEPNHPFHAMAWLGGGELIALLGEWWLAGGRSASIPWKKFVWPLAAVSFSPVAALVGGSAVLSFTDHFMTRLHNDYIQEFLPMWRTLRGFTGKMIFQVIVVDTAPLFAAIATITYRRRETPVVLWFATVIAACLTVMAWAQSRWLLNASGGQICLALVVLASWIFSFRPAIRWVAAIATISVLFLPTAVMRYRIARSDVDGRRVMPRDAHGMLSRDIAAALRATQPQGDITVLASPNASTAIGYFGRFKTLGTLYWENHAGLKAAAAIFAAKDEKEAAELIKKHKITHLALVSEEAFIAEYYKLLHPAASNDEIRRSFGYRLFYDKVVPQWLQMIPYRIPDDLTTLKNEVMLLKVNFEQTLPEAIYFVALNQIAQGLMQDADRTLDVLIQHAPQLSEPWLRKGEIAIGRHSWDEATDHLLKGISYATPDTRATLAIAAAGTLFKLGQHAHAVRIYRASLQETRTPDIVCYLAWTLATSPQDNLRNGREALELAQESLKADPNSPSYLSAMAAALAENGRYGEAVTYGDKALANARLRGEVATIQTMLQRLELLRNGKPIRS